MISIHWFHYFITISFLFMKIVFLQRRRCATLVTSSKHRDHKLNKYVLALKVSEPRVRELNGVALPLVQKVDNQNFHMNYPIV